MLRILSPWDNLLETSFELQIQSGKDGARSGSVILHFNEEKCHPEQRGLEILSHASVLCHSKDVS